MLKANVSMILFPSGSTKFAQSFTGNLIFALVQILMTSPAQNNEVRFAVFA